MSDSREQTMNERYEACMRACDACARACDQCAVACLREPDASGLAACVRLDIDCALMCRFASGAIARRSARAGDVCRLCADICEACARECDKHAHAHCRECAHACRACASACVEMT
ncbi:four-helix bundle copper-binding protein [Burkholderia pseudomallei]|nr:four-helix bundle copper-binding protein [Burkholderia pseudomallei]OMS57359.1 ferredoxin [Burkholderia pseudomallei]